MHAVVQTGRTPQATGNRVGWSNDTPVATFAVPYKVDIEGVLDNTAHGAKLPFRKIGTDCTTGI